MDYCRVRFCKVRAGLPRAWQLGAGLGQARAGHGGIFAGLPGALSSRKLGLGSPGLDWTTDGLGSGKLGLGRPRGARTQEPRDTGLLANRAVSTNGSRLAQAKPASKALQKACPFDAWLSRGVPLRYPRNSGHTGSLGKYGHCFFLKIVVSCR